MDQRREDGLDAEVSLFAVIRTLGRACDVAAARPYGYSQRVTRTALRLAQDLSLPDDLCADLLIASMCHSAGVAAVSGDLARVLGSDERATLRMHPSEIVFEILDADNGHDGGGDPHERTGIFLRHYAMMERFPAWTRAWLQRAGLTRAGDICLGMFDVLARVGQDAHVRAASAVLGVAYHMVSLRWLAHSDSPQEKAIAQDATALLGDSDWIQRLAGVRFDRSILELAAELWADTGFWEEMDKARTGAFVRPKALDTAPDGPTNALEALGKDVILDSYTFSANEFGHDVPDLAVAVKDLLVPRMGDTLRLDQPQLEGWLSILGAMVDRKTVFDDAHTDRIVNLSGELGLLMQLPDATLQQLRLASLVYGIGRLALPSSMLETRMSLTAEQRTMLRDCPTVARSILAPLAPLDEMLEIVEAHAERLDGSGHPLGSTSAAIPMGARILAVVDTFEALIAERPYRPAHARARALHILQGASGKLFDGVVTDTLEGVARGEL